MLASYRVHEMRVTRCANAGPVSLAHKGLPLPHCMQDILPSNLRKNFSYLALLAMQHDRLAFQNSFSVWTTYEIDPYHVYVLLTHSVSEAAKTFGKSQYPYVLSSLCKNSSSEGRKPIRGGSSS